MLACSWVSWAPVLSVFALNVANHSYKNDQTRIIVVSLTVNHIEWPDGELIET
jgi:hypothetical protein